MLEEFERLPGELLPQRLTPVHGTTPHGSSAPADTRRSLSPARTGWYSDPAASGRASLPLAASWPLDTPCRENGPVLQKSPPARLYARTCLPNRWRLAAAPVPKSNFPNAPHAPRAGSKNDSCWSSATSSLLSGPPPTR